MSKYLQLVSAPDIYCPPILWLQKRLISRSPNFNGISITDSEAGGVVGQQAIIDNEKLIGFVPFSVPKMHICSSPATEITNWYFSLRAIQLSQCL